MDELKELETLGSNVSKFDPQKAAQNRNQREVSNQAAREDALKKVNPLLDKLADPNVDFKAKLDVVGLLQREALPSLFQELAARVPDTDRSLVASRTILAIGAMSKTLLERRAADSAEELDPHSPKFQLVLGWFLELLHEAMKAQNVDSITINNTFQDLSARLSGWEETVSKKLKGVSSKALGSIKNPFVEEFWENTRKPKDSGE